MCCQSQNVLREILKKLAVIFLAVLEKRPAGVLKESQRDVCRVTSLIYPQDVKFESLVQMHFLCIIFNFFSPNVCLKH